MGFDHDACLPLEWQLQSVRQEGARSYMHRSSSPLPHSKPSPMATPKRQRKVNHTTGDSSSPKNEAVAIDTEFGRVTLAPSRYQAEKQALLRATHHSANGSGGPECRQSISRTVTQSSHGIAGIITSKLLRTEDGVESLRDPRGELRVDPRFARTRMQRARVLQRNLASKETARQQPRGDQMAVQTSVGGSKVRTGSQLRRRQFVDERSDSRSSEDPLRYQSLSYESQGNTYQTQRHGQNEPHGDGRRRQDNSLTRVRSYDNNHRREDTQFQQGPRSSEEQASPYQTRQSGQNEPHGNRQRRQDTALTRVKSYDNNHRREDTHFQQDPRWSQSLFSEEQESPYQTRRYQDVHDEHGHSYQDSASSRTYGHKQRRDDSLETTFHSPGGEKNLRGVTTKAVFRFRKPELRPPSPSGRAVRNVSPRPRDTRPDQRLVQSGHAARHNSTSPQDERGQQVLGFQEDSNRIRNPQTASSSTANVRTQRTAQEPARVAGVSLPPSVVRDESDTAWVSIERLQDEVTALFDQSLSSLETKKTKPHLTRLLRRADRFSAEHCIQCEVIVHKKWQCAFSSPSQACEQCVKARRPCAKLIEIDGQGFVEWLPVADGNGQWGRVSFWKSSGI